MTETETRRVPLRVLLALDPAAPEACSLEILAALVAGMEIELLGVLVEDENLLRLARLPHAREIALGTARAQALDPARLERQLSARAALARQAFQRAAARMRLHAEFITRRGELLEEIRRMAEDVDLLVVGRAAALAGPRTWLGAGIQQLAVTGPRITVFVQEPWSSGRCVLALYDGGSEAAAAAAIASRVALAEHVPLVILVPGHAPIETQALERAALQAVHEAGGHARIRRVGSAGVGELIGAVRAEDARALVLPGNEVDVELVRKLIERSRCSLVLAR